MSNSTMSPMPDVRTDRPSTFEVFAVGAAFDHERRAVVTAAESAIFCKQTHLLEGLGQQRGCGEQPGPRLVHPLFVFATVLGLSVEDLSEAGGAFLGLDELTFAAPVVSGSILAARSVVRAARPSRSRPGWGVVTWSTSGYVDGGDEAVSFLRTNLVPAAEEGDG